MSIKTKRLISFFLLIVHFAYLLFSPLSLSLNSVLASEKNEVSFSLEKNEQSEALKVNLPNTSAEKLPFFAYYQNNGIIEAGKGDLKAVSGDYIYSYSQSGDDFINHNWQKLVLKVNLGDAISSYWLQKEGNGEVIVERVAKSGNLDMGLEDQQWLIWAVNENEKTATTSDNVVLYQGYIFPLNSDVSVTFTKLPDNPSPLTIKQIELSEELAEKYGTSVAYDITTEMANGTFEFDLKLPKPKNVGNVEGLEVVYAEEIDDLAFEDRVNETNFEEVGNQIVAEGLDHLTVFVVTNSNSQENCDIVLSGTTPNTTCFPTIQQAINIAVDGDDIYVAAGTYNEYLSINGKAVNIFGAGADTTTINDPYTGAVITINNSTTTTSMVIEGFTIDAATADIGVIIQGSSTVTIQDSQIIDFIDRGVSISGGGSNVIQSNVIESSLAGANAGLYVDNQSGGNSIDSNTITLPTSGSGNLYGINFAGTNSKDNEVKNNTIVGGTRGFQQDGGVSGTTTFLNNDITNTSYAGVFLNGGSVVIDDNTFTNTIRPVEFWAQDVNILNNVIDGANWDGINIQDYSGSVIIQNNSFTNIGANAVYNRKTDGSIVNARNNSWGDDDNSGPYDEWDDGSKPSTNPSGTGASVKGKVDYQKWDGSETYSLNVEVDEAEVNNIYYLKSGTDNYLDYTITSPSKIYGQTIYASLWGYDSGTESRTSDRFIGSVQYDANGVLVDEDVSWEMLTDHWMGSNPPGTIIPEGDYLLWVERYYDGGDYVNGSTIKKRITVDNTRPTGQITNPANGDFINGNLIVTGSVDDNLSGIDKVEVRLRNYPGNTYRTPWVNAPLDVSNNYSVTIDTTIIPDDVYEVAVVAYDKAGNSKWLYPRPVITVDNTAPNMPELVAPASGAVIKPALAVLDWTTETDANGPVTYNYKSFWTGGNYGPVTTGTNSQINASGSSDRVYNWQVQACDSLNNCSAWSGPWEVTIDGTAPGSPGVPQTVLGSPTNSAIQSWSWTAANDNLSGILGYSYQILDVNSGLFSAWNPLGDVLGTDTSLLDGSWQFWIKSQDGAGNYSSGVGSATLEVDLTSPATPTLISPINNAFVKGNPVQTWSPVSGAHHYMYESYRDAAATDKIYGTTVTNNSRTVGGNQNITFYWRVKAVDLAGNESPWSELWKMTVDNKAPELQSQTPFSGWHNTPQTSTFTYSDVNGIVSGEPVSCQITTEGTNQTCSVTPSVCDQAGNCNTTSVTSDGANLDFTNPASDINTPTNEGDNSIVYSNSWNGEVAGTASDNLSDLEKIQLVIQNGVGEYWNGTNWQMDLAYVVATGTATWTYSMSTPPPEGTYTITSHAVDNAGNMESSYKLTIVLDKTIPEVTITLNPTEGDAQNGWYKTQPEVTLIATDTNKDIVEYQWDSQTGTWQTYSDPFKLANEGAHILYYRARDKAKNYSEIGVKNIKWDKTELSEGPLNIKVNPNPTSGSEATASWDRAEDAVGISYYRISWNLEDGDDNHSKDVGNGETETAIDGLKEGVYKVTVTAYDYAGNNKSASTNLTVDRTAPTAPVLTLAGTGVGTVSLSWLAVEDASDYVVLYGTESGNYLYAAVVGNVNQFLVEGLSAGNYYFVVRSRDSVKNQSGNSNEVNTGAILGGAGVGGPATGFQEAGEVLGEKTEKNTLKNKKSVKGAIVQSQKTGEVLGAEKGRTLWEELISYFKSHLPLVFVTSISLVFLLFLIVRALRRRNQ